MQSSLLFRSAIPCGCSPHRGKASSVARIDTTGSTVAREKSALISAVQQESIIGACSLQITCAYELRSVLCFSGKAPIGMNLAEGKFAHTLAQHTHAPQPAAVAIPFESAVRPRCSARMSKTHQLLRVVPAWLFAIGPVGIFEPGSGRGKRKE
jgi:hypothetical protein